AFLESQQSTIGGHWAGATVDHDDGGRRRWFVTSDAARRRLEVALAAAPDARQLPVDIAVVVHSLTELESGVDELNARLLRAGVVVTDLAVDVAHNRLSIGLPANAAAYEQQRSHVIDTLSTAGGPAPAATYVANRDRALDRL